MRRHNLKSDTLLLCAAMIWGFAFVAQRKGMEYVGPFLFNGIRFALGALVLVPFLLRRSREAGEGDDRAAPGNLPLNPGPPHTPRRRLHLALGTLLAGLTVFGGASFQQMGLVRTTASNAGFITGLYVLIVPILGLFWNQRPGAVTWIGATLAAGGLYFLSVGEGFTIAPGDLLVLVCAFIWACHVHLIGWLSPRTTNPLRLAFLQFAICSLLSLVVAFFREEIALEAILDASIPIVYGGAISVGIAYTLQVVAQRRAHPSHAAILLSLEAVFAALGGWLLLGETLSQRGIAGCTLMLTGMLLSQVGGGSRRHTTVTESTHEANNRSSATYHDTLR